MTASQSEFANLHKESLDEIKLVGGKFTARSESINARKTHAESLMNIDN